MQLRAHFLVAEIPERFVQARTIPNAA
jgi:hypothetical protein